MKAIADKPIILSTLACLISFLSFFVGVPNKEHDDNKLIDEIKFDGNYDTINAPIIDTIDSNWDILTEAIIWVESRGNEAAVGQKDDIGVLQIRPIFVQEANRIIGFEKYSLDDRYSRDRSIEIWNVVQQRHNPNCDHFIAIDIHNPNAPNNYVNQIIMEYNALKNTRDESIGSF